MVRIRTNDTVKVVDETSRYSGDTGLVIGVVKAPAGMRLRNHLQVRLNRAGTVDVFLPEQLEVTG